MGRRVDPEHQQAISEDWRRRLLAIAWGKGGAPADARLLVESIGVVVGAEDADSRRRLETAARDLRAAVSAVSDPPVRPDPLDAWVYRHLVRRGPALLVPEDMRRATLARARDARRRRARSDQKIHAARVEMSAEAWRMLQAHRERLQTRETRKLSLGATLEIIIAAYDGWSTSAVPRKRVSSGRDRAAAEGDLFAGPPGRT